jgi:hypothetical protein
MTTQWQFFPKSNVIPSILMCVIEGFINCEDEIASAQLYDSAKSNDILKILEPKLLDLGFLVETGKTNDEKIHVPVLFGRNGKVEKSFEADAWHVGNKIVLEIEAGRGVINNQFLKDLFQACMMQDIDYLSIAIRNEYCAGTSRSKDFERVVMFFETLYASNRLMLPLKGILVIGYGTKKA